MAESLTPNADVVTSPTSHSHLPTTTQQPFGLMKLPPQAVMLTQGKKYLHFVWRGGAQGEGVLGFDLDGGVPPKPQNPYPFLRVIFAKKGTHF